MKGGGGRAAPPRTTGLPAPHRTEEEVIDVIQLSTYDALPGRMTDDAARAARRRLAHGGRSADRRHLLTILVPSRRRRAAELRRAV